MIFTSLIFLLCQTVPDAAASTQAPDVSQESLLALAPDTWDTYLLAMHMIDVRGRYEEGAEKLLDLVDKEDVISDRGQASWMLAQAARALTLAGKNDEAAKLLPGARNGSRGTVFEEPIDVLLSSFAPQSAGLDPEFLQFVRDWLSGKDRSIYGVSEVGRELLPYLRFVVDDAQGGFSLQERSSAVFAMFAILDASAGQWLSARLVEAEPLTVKRLLRSFSSIKTFHDLEARSAAFQCILDFIDGSQESLKPFALDLLVSLVGTTATAATIPSEDPILEDLFSAILAQIERGNRGTDGKAFTRLASLSWGNKVSYRPLILALTNHENIEIQEEFRWALVFVEGGISYLRELVPSGSFDDQLRFCLALSSGMLWQPSFSFLGWEASVRQWAQSYLDQDAAWFAYLKKKNPKHPSEEDVALLIELKSSMHPLLRFLASTTLFSNGEILAALAFLEDVGEDSSWAQFLLGSWVHWSDTEITAPALQILEPLATAGPLQNEVRLLLEERGQKVLTPTLWEKLDLDPSREVGEAIFYRARREGTSAELLWLMLHADWPLGRGLVARSLAEKWPLEYLQHLGDLEDVGRRWVFVKSEEDAWKGALRLIGPQVFSDNLGKFEEILFHNAAPSVSKSLVFTLSYEDPDLLLAIALDCIAKPEDLRFLFGQANWNNVANRIQDKEAASAFLSKLPEAGFLDLIRNDYRSLRGLVVPASQASIPFYKSLWKEESLDSSVQSDLIRDTIRTPSLRTMFHDQLVLLIRNPERTRQICKGYVEEGAVSEILEELILALNEPLAAENICSILAAIGSVDEPRVVEILLGFLDDPRQSVSLQVSSSLNRLRGIRAQKEEWDAWVSGEDGEPLSVVEALINNLKDSDLEIRLVSIQSLGTLGEKNALPALINLLRDENSRIKEAARKALDRINKDDAAAAKELAKAQLTLHLTVLEGELAALRLEKSDQHPEVAALLQKIEAAKKKLGEL